MTVPAAPKAARAKKATRAAATAICDMDMDALMSEVARRKAEPPVKTERVSPEPDAPKASAGKTTKAPAKPKPVRRILRVPETPSPGTLAHMVDVNSRRRKPSDVPTTTLPVALPTVSLLEGRNCEPTVSSRRAGDRGAADAHIDEATLQDMHQRVCERGERLVDHLRASLSRENPEADAEAGAPNRLAMVERAIRELERAAQGLHETKADLVRTFDRFGEYFRSSNPVNTPEGPMRTVALVGGGEATVHAHSMLPPLPPLDASYLGAQRLHKPRKVCAQSTAKAQEVEVDESVTEEPGGDDDSRVRGRIVARRPYAVEEYSDADILRRLPATDPRSPYHAKTDQKAVLAEMMERRAELEALTNRRDKRAMHVGGGKNLETYMAHHTRGRGERLMSTIDELEKSAAGGGDGAWRDRGLRESVARGVRDVQYAVGEASERHRRRLPVPPMCESDDDDDDNWGVCGW